MLPLVIQIERTEERVADTCAFAKSPVRIGRNPLSDLQLDESFVSQWHGVIRFDAERTVYVDLGSTNPTIVDGQPVKRNVEVVVTDTTDIRIGTLRLHLFRVSAPPELFGARRKSSFVRASAPGFHTNNVDATVFLGGAVRRSSVPVKPKDKPGLASAQTELAKPHAASSPQPSAAARAETSSDLRALHADYRACRDRLVIEVQRQLRATQDSEREGLFELLMREYPDLGHDPQFRSMLGELGISSWRSGVPEISDWLRRLTDGLYPPPGLSGQTNLALAMERIGEILEVFSAAFIELRVAHEQFCAEMALEEPVHDTLLNSSTNPRAMLAYLLNPTGDHGSRVGDLARAMADFAVHQVALVSATVQGARDTLAELAPDKLAGRDRPGVSFFSKLLGQDQKDMWTRYVKTFDELLDADRFTRKLFGPGFARKYYAITGGRRSVAPPRRMESLKP